MAARCGWSTRMRPKRLEELIGGSLHWIVKHRLIARQQILRIEDRKDGRIDIVVAGALELIPPAPKRAHQGWRYLTDDDVPTDDWRRPRRPPAAALRQARRAWVWSECLPGV